MDAIQKFFHACASYRKGSNKVERVRVMDDSWITEVGAMKDLFTTDFQTLFTSGQPSTNLIEETLSMVSPRLTEAMISDFLTRRGKRIIELIMWMVSTVTYSVILNSAPVGLALTRN
ncbi:hypothetical protein M569_00392 [Genlisea aurea]|uniref:Uncharacterized protein n=1 Tax=Genlisea aurea TaxID=192259 RepID=S8D4R0_9LAMI|nr:hypothetical protein M569_00392 [Genlisea aurea]